MAVTGLYNIINSGFTIDEHPASLVCEARVHHSWSVTMLSDISSQYITPPDTKVLLCPFQVVCSLSWSRSPGNRMLCAWNQFSYSTAIEC